MKETSLKNPLRILKTFINLGRRKLRKTANANKYIKHFIMTNTFMMLSNTLHQTNNLKSDRLKDFLSFVTMRKNENQE